MVCKNCGSELTRAGVCPLCGKTAADEAPTENITKAPVSKGKSFSELGNEDYNEDGQLLTKKQRREARDSAATAGKSRILYWILLIIGANTIPVHCFYVRKTLKGIIEVTAALCFFGLYYLYFGLSILPDKRYLFIPSGLLVICLIFDVITGLKQDNFR